MRIIICSLILFISLASSAQSRWTAAFPVKKTFEAGDFHTYQVTDFFKIDNLLFGGRSEVESIVTFRVVDTAAGGYWLNYTINTNAVKQRKDSSAYIVAELTDGIQLFIYLRNGKILMDSITYFKTKNRIIAKLDSIASRQTSGKSNTQFIKYLQAELKEDAGLGSLLHPLMVFETYYSLDVFKKFRLTGRGKVENILNRPLFDGNAETEWESTSKDSTVQLNYLFTADPVPAARYYRSKYEPLFTANNIKQGKYFYPPEVRHIADYTFRTQPGRSFPVYMYQKIVSEYIFRSVGRIEMKEIVFPGDELTE